MHDVRLVQWLACIVALLAMGAAARAQPTSDPSPLMTKHLVDIGGRKVNFVCAGHDAPTVVFEYGLGGHLLNWQKVQPAVSALTTTCFYDRAGYGTSDPSPRPMTAQNVTDDFYWLLRKADVDLPIVLVGHSLGGLYATLYADRFQADVAGMVLIDPSFAGQDLGETPEEQHRSETLFNASQTEIAGCADLARQGKLSRGNPTDCFQPAPGRTGTELDCLADQFFKPFRWEAMLSESRNLHAAGALSEDEQEEQRATTSFGDKPLIVLTAGIAPKQPDETEDEHRKNMAHWKAGHDRLASRSSRGRSTVVPNASHMIQLDQPQAVIDAVRDVVIEIRKAKAAPLPAR